MMQKLTDGVKRVDVRDFPIRQIVENLEQQYPGVIEYLYEPDEDRLKPGFTVFVDGEVATLGLMEPVQENSEVHFVPAIGGGS